MEETIKGKVTYWNTTKGYGFIKGEEGKDYFVHYTDILMDGRKDLKDAQDVNFLGVEGSKGFKAVMVKPEVVITEEERSE